MDKIDMKFMYISGQEWNYGRVIPFYLVPGQDRYEIHRYELLVWVLHESK
jgi:hypothetical protein